MEPESAWVNVRAAAKAWVFEMKSECAATMSVVVVLARETGWFSVAWPLPEESV